MAGKYDRALFTSVNVPRLGRKGLVVVGLPARFWLVWKPWKLGAPHHYTVRVLDKSATQVTHWLDYEETIVRNTPDTYKEHDVFLTPGEVAYALRHGQLTELRQAEGAAARGGMKS